MNLYEVLRRPLVTEKNAVLQAGGKYVFEVAGESTKPQIKQAVEKAFKVKVIGVNVMTVPGKERRIGRRHVRTQLLHSFIPVREAQHVRRGQGTLLPPQLETDRQRVQDQRILPGLLH